MSLSRRRLLLGAGAVVAVSAFPMSVRSQESSSILRLSQGGIPIISGNVGGVNLTKSQISTLNRVALQVARAAPSRAAANGTLSAIVRTVVTSAPRAGIYGLAAAAVVGGAYYLFTGNNPLDPLMNLTFGGEGMFVAYPCSCTGLPVNGGSYPDTVVMGWFRNSTCNNTAFYRMALVTNLSAGSAANPGGWNWAYTQSLGGGQYRHFYTKSIVMDAGSCGSSYIDLPGNTDWGRTLSAADKLKALSGAALDALGLSAWSWTADPALGNGGSQGGGGASGGFISPPQSLKNQITQAPLDEAAIVAPLPYVGTEPEPAPITVGEMLEPWPMQGDPGPVEYPPSVKFPEDEGYEAPTGPGAPEVPEEPGEGSDWTSWLPRMPNFGLPGLPELGFPDLVDWSPSALTQPSFATQCIDPALAFTFDAGAYGSFPMNLALPACEYLTPLGSFIKPAVIAGSSIVAAKKVLDL